MCIDLCVIRAGMGDDVEKLGPVVQWESIQAGPGMEAGIQYKRTACARPSLGSGEIF